MKVSESPLEQKLDKVQETVNQLISPPPEIMTIPDAPKFLQRKISTIRSWQAARQIPHYKRNGTIYFLRSELLAWIKRGRVKTQIEQISDIVTNEAQDLQQPKNHRVQRRLK
jgi:hypothetical protein